MEFITRVEKIPLNKFAMRILIFCFCLGFVFSALRLVGFSDFNLVGTPILVSLSVFSSQFALRCFQIKTKTQYTFLGLSLSLIAVKNFLYGIALVFVIGFLTLILELILGWVKFTSFIWQSNDWDIMKIELASILLVICQQLTAGWWEELLFRGYLIQIPGTKNGFVLSAIASSLIFGISHHLVPPNIPLEVVPIDIAIGLLLAYCYTRNGLWFTFGLHFALNTIPNSLLGLTNSGISMIKLSYQFPSWITISGTLIQPWLLLFLFVLVVFSVRAKPIYSISSNLTV